MATTTNCDDETTAINEQRFELSNAKSTEFDLDFAFRLQLEEALAASLTLVPSSSEIPEASSSHNDGDDSNLVELHTSELEKLEQEKRDRELSEIEARKLKDDFDRRIHDQKLAMDIFRLSDEYWDDCGNEFERPFGEGSSSSSSDSNMICRLYFKGMVSVETVGSSKETLSGIGVAICDDRDNLIFQLSKPLEGNAINRTITEIKALTEGLEIALALNLKRITIFFSYLPIYRFALNAWKPKQRKVATLMDKVGLLRQKFAFFCPRLVSVNGIKFAFKLARDAIDSQMSKLSASNHLNNLRETCLICLEETDQDKMFSIDGCLHKYCFSCMKQHVEAKLHDGILPKCLHESCGNDLNVISCEKFLTPKLIEIMKQQVREASIPVSEKVYCPYPRCSALMSKAEAYDFAEKENVGLSIAGVRKCLKCGRLFCIHCRVLWHYNKTCGMYMKSNAYPLSEDAKLKSLATRNLWRQCVKCKHMIELAQGCYHMTCRCGYEFCYTCGAEWKNKKATCSCPLWNERNILFEESDYDDEDDEDDDDDDSDYYSDSD